MVDTPDYLCARESEKRLRRRAKGPLSSFVSREKTFKLARTSLIGLLAAGEELHLSESASCTGRGDIAGSSAVSGVKFRELDRSPLIACVIAGSKNSQQVSCKNRTRGGDRTHIAWKALTRFVVTAQSKSDNNNRRTRVPCGGSRGEQLRSRGSDAGGERAGRDLQT